VSGTGTVAKNSSSGAPTGGWSQVESQGYPDLFPNAPELEAEWFRRTGIYPMHGTIVVRDSVLAAHPWVARSLYDAFEAAKQKWLKRLKSGDANTALDQRYRALAGIVGDDPLPFGMVANMPTILALEDTAFKQGLSPRRMMVEELFVDPLK
jgi:4,5-dihydroxyphthalate decarboxylase